MIHEVVATVVAHHDAASGYKLLELDVPRKALDCRPGQFFHILCPVDAQNQPFLRRPMSIYGYDRDAGGSRFSTRSRVSEPRRCRDLPRATGSTSWGRLETGSPFRRTRAT